MKIGISIELPHLYEELLYNSIVNPNPNPEWNKINIMGKIVDLEIIGVTAIWNQLEISYLL